MIRYTIYIALLFVSLASCDNLPKDVPTESLSLQLSSSEVSLIVLGNVQDAGSPHMGCKKSCCSTLFEKRDNDRMVVSLGLVDPTNKKQYIFEASPDFHLQAKYLKELSGLPQELPDGIFLTHAHIGHYTGLMYLGKEAINADLVPVYAMPRMKSFLETNGPWSQLVSLKNIDIKVLSDRKEQPITSNFKVVPFRVPHRDEYSETVGYKIIGPKKSALFIPDIDKWEKWEDDIIKELDSVDFAFLDATFYDAKEINYRDISQIPHPFAIESMEKFSNLSTIDKKKIYFIHLNHTNPLLDKSSEASKMVIDKGFNVARKGMTFTL